MFSGFSDFIAESRMKAIRPALNLNHTLKASLRPVQDIQ